MEKWREKADKIFNRKFNYIHLIVTFILSFTLTLLLLDILDYTNVIDIF
jgi:hypothetical protein